MYALPQIAGTGAAMSGSIQMIVGAVSSELVACLYDGRSALSMAVVMTSCSLLALASYLLIARPAERRIFASAR
jgi:DHA1 family bicyclomycin/chloramphenicol resistance-like MFS transporter